MNNYADNRILGAGKYEKRNFWISTPTPKTTTTPPAYIAPARTYRYLVGNAIWQVDMTYLRQTE